MQLLVYYYVYIPHSSSWGQFLYVAVILQCRDHRIQKLGAGVADLAEKVHNMLININIGNEIYSMEFSLSYAYYKSQVTLQIKVGLNTHF